MHRVSVVGSFALGIVKQAFNILKVVVPLAYKGVWWVLKAMYAVLVVMWASLLPQIAELTDGIYQLIGGRFPINLQNLSMHVSSIGASFIVLSVWIILAYATTLIFNLLVRGMMMLVGMI